jgi:hypothetical protein
MHWEKEHLTERAENTEYKLKAQYTVRSVSTVRNKQRGGTGKDKSP